MSSPSFQFTRVATLCLAVSWMAIPCRAQRVRDRARHDWKWHERSPLDPDLILLDEVMAGMTRHEQEDIRQVLRGLRELGVAVIAVEHVIAAVADRSDRIMALDFGRVIATE